MTGENAIGASNNDAQVKPKKNGDGDDNQEVMVVNTLLTFIMCYSSNVIGNKLPELVAKHYCGNEF